MVRGFGKNGVRITVKVFWCFCLKEKVVLLGMVNSRKCCMRCRRRRADEFFEAEAEICRVCVNELAPRKNCSSCRRNRRVEEFDEGYMSCRRCIENMKLYREIHKDKRMEQNKDYRERHKDEILAKNKDYREKKKEERKLYNSLVVRCDVCDCDVLKCHFARHKKTNKHTEKLRMQEAD